MQALKERILSDAKHLGNGVIKVDSFMNHQIDSLLMQAIGQELAQRLAHTKPNKILTAETSGIAPAFAVGVCLKLPVVFARKHQSITMAEKSFRQVSPSPTHGGDAELIVSAEYLGINDRVLIIDDFLASGKTTLALIELVKQSGATLVGIGAVLEKVYGEGRKLLSNINVPIECLASITGYEGERILLQ